MKGKLKIESFVVNPVQAHCFVVSDDSGEAVIIDNGRCYAEEYKALERYVQTESLHVIEQWLTHAHFDHMLGVGEAYQRYGAGVRFHQPDSYLYKDPGGQMRMLFGSEFPCRPAPVIGGFSEEEELVLGHHSFRVIFTPGHTPGGVCFYCEEEKILFSGDSLFANSIGRTDLPGGDFQLLSQSLREKLMVLPEDVIVFPGHGPYTSIGKEKESNPYL